MAHPINHPITEKELLKEFEKYRKILQELEALYGILPAETPGKIEEPNYVSEATFSYQVHSST
jgi:hypothetical protein